MNAFKDQVAPIIELRGPAGFNNIGSGGFGDDGFLIVLLWNGTPCLDFRTRRPWSKC